MLEFFLNKQFDAWNKKKKSLEYRNRVIFYHSREIWWCSLGVNIGYEQDGKGAEFTRPVLVIKGFNPNMFFGVALTGKRKEGRFYYYLGKINGHDSSVILSQVRLIDTKRLQSKMITIDEETFHNVCERIKRILF